MGKLGSYTVNIKANEEKVTDFPHENRYIHFIVSLFSNGKWSKTKSRIS